MITIYERTIIINNNHIRIINKKKPKKMVKVSGDVKVQKHTYSEEKVIDWGKNPKRNL